MCNKVVIQVRDLWPEHFYTVKPKYSNFPYSTVFDFFMWMRSRALKNADYVIAASKKILDALKKDLDVKNSSVIYNSTKLSHTSNTGNRIFRKYPDEILCNYSGTLGETYDLELLIEAATSLARDNLNDKFRIIISGVGPKEYLFNGLAEDLPITYVGLLSDFDLASLYNQLDFTILPYKVGSTVDVPAKVFDYLQRSIPIVYSISGEVDSILSEAQHYGKFLPGNVDSLKQQLKLFMTKEVRLKAIHGLKLISNNYSSDHAVEEFSEVYKILLESHNAYS
jgi:glycosyltransferase involved in cell wall biosynthesis